MHRSTIVGILEESRYWANSRKQKIVHKEDVEKAIDAKFKRRDKIRKEYYDDILSEFIMIDTRGEAVDKSMDCRPSVCQIFALVCLRELRLLRVVAKNQWLISIGKSI